MSNEEESHLMNECFTTLLTNQDDFLWINFIKPCGYKFMYPFQRSDTIQALYRHLDNLWVGNHIFVWFQLPAPAAAAAHIIYLNRSDHLSIRDFLYRHHILRSNEMSYNVFFDTIPHQHPPFAPQLPLYKNVNNMNMNNNNNNNNVNVVNNVPWPQREMQLPHVCACHPPSAL